MYAIHMYHFYRCKSTLFFLIWLLPTFAYWKVDQSPVLSKSFYMNFIFDVNVITVNHLVTDSRLSLLADLSAQRQTVSVNSILSSCITTRLIATRWQKAMLWLNDKMKKGDDLRSYNQMTHYQTDILWYVCGDVIL